MTDFVTTGWKIRSEKVKTPLRLMLIGDLHDAEHGPGNDALKRAVREAAPDLILCAGDLIVGRPGRPRETALDLMSFCAVTAPVYMVYGNHETQLRLFPGEEEPFRRRLAATGVHLLNNTGASLEMKGTPLVLYGLELPLSVYRKLRIPRLTDSGITERIGPGPASAAFSVLLAHNPQFAPQYARWGADLTVCGHFHGGVLRIGQRCLLSPYGFPFPKYGYGHYETDGRHMIVTAGLGEHTIPFRIHNPMELAVIDILPAEEAENGN